MNETEIVQAVIAATKIKTKNNTEIRKTKPKISEMGKNYYDSQTLVNYRGASRATRAIEISVASDPGNVQMVLPPKPAVAFLCERLEVSLRDKLGLRCRRSMVVNVKKGMDSKC